MPRVEYSHAERQALGLHHKRRRQVAIKQPAFPPVVWMLGLALLLTFASLMVHQPVTIMGQTGASSTVIEAGGRVTQTAELPDGRKTVFKVQNSGWPFTSSIFSCYGIAPECKNGSHINWLATIADMMVWFLTILVLRVGYLTFYARR